MLACLYYSRHRRPWLAIERTGGYGLAMIDTLFHEYGYRQMYTRRKADAPTGNYADRHRLGHHQGDQGPAARGGDAAAQRGHARDPLAQTGPADGDLRQTRLGRTGPIPGAHSDLLLAWMIAQTVATRSRRESSASRQSARRAPPVRYRVTGY